MSAHLRKFVFLPIALAGLGVVFIVICALLRFRGDGAVLLRRKLRVGAMILLLQGVATHGTLAGASCYEQAMPFFQPGSHDIGPIVMEAGEPLTLEATLMGGYDPPFTYAVLDGETVLQWGEVEVVDGELDHYEEAVTITIDPAGLVANTEYELRLLWGGYESATACLAADSWNVLESYRLGVH